ncbi:MAG: peptidylprolyl isomerase [Candidatus Scalindua sediminis]|nr:peptidylprolyl isomerase [Candidatus Scalindua sediminis]
MKFLRWVFFISILQLFCSYQTNADNLNAVRVVVNGEIITEFDIRKRIAEAFQIAGEKYQGVEFQQKRRQIMSDAIDELIDRKILVQEAKKVILLDPEKVEEIEKNLDLFVKGAVEEVGSLYKFYELAHKQGINPLKKKAELKEDLMVDVILRENVYRKIVITPKDMKRYYQDNIDEFSGERKLSFRQILIKYSGYKTKEEAKSVAEKLLNRLEDGEEFEVVAKEHSQGPHAYRGGLWEFDEVRDFRKDLVAIVSELKGDEISQIIETSIGCHIFKIEEIIPAKITSFQQAQGEISNTLFREKFLKQKRKYLQELKRDVVIKRYY